MYTRNMLISPTCHNGHKNMAEIPPKDHAASVLLQTCLVATDLSPGTHPAQAMCSGAPINRIVDLPAS